jgi:hypothetical protein
MKEALKRWWHGVFTLHDNPHNSPLYFVGGYHKRHWTSHAAHVVADFWVRHWQWCFSATFATIGLVIAALKL